MSPWHGCPAAGCARPSPPLAGPCAAVLCCRWAARRRRAAPTPGSRRGGSSVPPPAAGPAAPPGQGSSGAWGTFRCVSAAGSGTSGLLPGAPVSRGSPGRLPRAAPACREGLARPFPVLAEGLDGQQVPTSATCQGALACGSGCCSTQLAGGAGKWERAFPSSRRLRRGSWPLPRSHPWCSCRRDLPAVPAATCVLRVARWPLLPVALQAVRCGRGRAAPWREGRRDLAPRRLGPVSPRSRVPPSALCRCRGLAARWLRGSGLASCPWPSELPLGSGVSALGLDPSPPQVSSPGRGSLVQSQESSAGTPRPRCRPNPALLTRLL